MCTLRIFVILLFTNIYSFSQPKIDSCKKIADKGLCKPFANNCLAKVKGYFNACKIVGDYYYSLKKYKKAIDYYELIADMNMDGHGPVDLLNIGIKEKHIYADTREKLGNMYLKGLGVKKNNLRALYYYNKYPNPFSQKKIDYFSKILLNSNEKAKILKQPNDSDTIVKLAINPLYLLDKTIRNDIKKIIYQIEEKLEKDTTLNCTITISGGLNRHDEIGQSVNFHFVNNLANFLNKDMRQKYIAYYNSDDQSDESDSKFNGIPFQTLTFHISKLEHL